MNRLAVALGILLATAAAAHAGLYLPGEPALPVVDADGKPTPLPLERFKLSLERPVRLGADVPGDDTRQKGLAEAAALRPRAARLAPEERLRLSGLLLRLRDFPGAQEVLRHGDPADQRDYRFLANRALAAFNDGDPAQAWRDQSAALDVLGTNAGWARKAEEAQKDLYRLRDREARAGGKPDLPDDLFGLHFAGPSGRYEAGTIAGVDAARLAEATALVQQLLYWMPEDTRLWWLLGELYNARGEVEDAARVFDECVDARRAGWPELLEHRRAVKTEAAHRAELRDRQEAARAAEQERADRAAEEQAERAWRPEGARMWLVLGGAGLLLALLLGWQARGLLRRLGGACETGH